MSSQYLRPLSWLCLPLLVVAATNATAYTASIPLPDITSHSNDGYVSENDTFTHFDFTATPAEAFAKDLPLDVFITGQISASMRCVNPSGCRSYEFALRGGVIPRLLFWEGQQTAFGGPTQSVGPTAYGELIELKPVSFATDPFLFDYVLAKGYGVLTTDTPGSVQYRYNSLSFFAMAFPTWGPTPEFGDYSIKLFNADLKVHGYPSAIPEPSISLMLTAGLAALGGLRRRVRVGK